jgi:hypothetical protein
MASDVVYTAIRQYLDGVNATPAAWSVTPIQYENEAPVAMADGSGTPTPWIMIEMTGTLYGQESIGANTQAQNRWDEEGQLYCHVFIPSGGGGLVARQLAKQFADLFRGTRLLSDQTLEFMDASIGMGEIGDDSGNWFRISVDIHWRRMEA